MNLLRNRMFWPVLAILVILILFTVVFFGLLILSFYYELPWMNTFMDWFSISTSSLIIIIISWQWRRTYKDSIEREKRQKEREYLDVDKEEWVRLGLPEHLYFPPFNYKKARRQIGILFSLAILANLASIIMNYAL